jgi:5-methylcytosine-specific restriction endonuclease McrA
VRICSGAGCLRKIEDGERYCSECLPKPVVLDDGIRKHNRVTEIVLSEADRNAYAFLYSGKRWQRLRWVIARQQALCQRCKAAPTAIIDHRVPAGLVIIQAQRSGLYPFDKFAGFYFRSNLQGLCRSCHGFKTEEDKAHKGEWPDAVERERSQPKRKFTF